MKHIWSSFCLVLMLVSSVAVQGQQTAAIANNPVVPPLVNFSGTLADLNGKPMNGAVGVTFLLYKDSQGGAPLWLETQSVQADKSGHYTATLGSTSSSGLPSDIFSAGEARWLGVQVQGQGEQPRVLLVAVPYALKAGDAQTIGGLPPSAFVLATPRPSDSRPVAKPESKGAPPAPLNVTTSGSGSAGTLTLFNSPTDVENSIVTQVGSGTTAKIGIGTTTPTTMLDIKGGSTVRGTLTSPVTGTATASAGKNSYPQNFVASAFNSSKSTAANQTFQWQAEPAANNTASPSGTLNLLFGQGAAKPAETGLNIASNGLITFAAGQTFPGTGNGTVSSVATGSGLTGGPITSTGTLAVDPTMVPLLAANNSFTGTQAIQNGNPAGALQVTNTVTSGKGPAIVGTTNSSAAAGVKGIIAATTGTDSGVFGQTSSPAGYGVTGAGGLYGVYGYGEAVGVRGSLGNTISKTGSGGWEAGGVWGDAAQFQNQEAGVTGTADDDTAGFFENNSGTDVSYTGVTLVATNLSKTTGAPVFWAVGLKVCIIDIGANLSCGGTIKGTVTTPRTAREVEVYSMQSAENWLEDAGAGQLSRGSASIALDPTFAETVNTSVEYHVFLTPRGDCEGLYVSNQTPQGFEVHELRGGRSSVAFDYRIMAKRLGSENDRLNDVTDKTRKADERNLVRPSPGLQSNAAPSTTKLLVQSNPKSAKR